MVTVDDAQDYLTMWFRNDAENFWNLSKLIDVEQWNKALTASITVTSSLPCHV